MKTLKFTLSLTLMLFLSITPATSQANNSQELETILSNPKGGISGTYWRKAVSAYLSSCTPDKCQCTFGLTEVKNPNTGAHWFGTFGSGQAQTIYNSTGRIHAAKWKGPYSKKLNKCIAGSSWAQKNSSGQCCRTGGHKPGRCRGCGAYEAYATYMGFPQSNRMKIIYYGSQLQGQYLLHDSTSCGGGNCTGYTWGCPTVDGRAMRDLCFKYIGQSAGVNSPLVRTPQVDQSGVWYYYYGNASGDRAADGLVEVKKKCGNKSFSQIDGTGSISTSLAAAGTSDDPTVSAGLSIGGGSVPGLGPMSGFFDLQGLAAQSIAIQQQFEQSEQQRKEFEEKWNEEKEDEDQEETPPSAETIAKRKLAYQQIGGDEAGQCFIINGEKVCGE